MGWQDAPVVSGGGAPSGQPAWMAAPEVQTSEPSLADKVITTAGNLAAGAVRGAGSIGATLLAPVDIASDLIEGKGLTLDANKQRRQQMDDALRTLGADPESIAYALGKLTGEVAGTAGTGGALANVAARVPGAAAAAPVIDAVRTAGMSAGGATGATGILARMAGGAATGGAAAALVDPTIAGEGAAIGAALPPAAAAAGKVGQAVGRVVTGPAQSAETAAAVRAARDAGYVVPPTQAKPTLINRALEGLSGKITTAQNASARNQVVTNGLAAKALGLPRDTQITPDLLAGIRDSAGKAYDAVGAAGTITPGPKYDAALDAIAASAKKAASGFPSAKPSPVIDLVDSLRSPVFDAESAVAKIKELRSTADDAFRSGNTDVGRAAKSASKALEDAIERHLAGSGQKGLLNGFRDARTLIAKTYSVQNALNPATGTIDAKALARSLRSGKPLSGEMKQAAEFASAFPKAAQATEGMGSLPQVSPLDYGAAVAAMLAMGDPTYLATVLARPAARATALSPLVQDRLIQQSGGGLSRLPFQTLEQLGFQAAPVTGASSGR